jgi:hypothetical protein
MATEPRGGAPLTQLTPMFLHLPDFTVRIARCCSGEIVDELLRG